MKVLELKEAPEGYPGWWALKVGDLDKEILVNNNWFGARSDLGLPKLQVGDEVEFDIGEPAYSNPSEYRFVKNFHVKDEGEAV